MNTQVLRFLRRGEVVSLANVPPDRTLLEVLREDLGLTGTKEGCGEGDCGACTVVLAEAQGKKLSYKAINSCIRLAHSVDGMAVFTAEDIAPAPATAHGAAAGSTGCPSAGAQPAPLHPAQEAMVRCHGSQCGFCTPGFVMSLFGMYQNHVCRGEPITRELAQHDLSGNLCRCTGYRPILDAAQMMASLPNTPLDERSLLQKLKQINPADAGPAPDSRPTRRARDAAPAYLAPDTLAQLLAARAAHPQAQVVAGCTDVGLWVTKMHRRFAQVLDVTRAREIRQVERYPHHIAIGAAVPLSEAFAALLKDRPQLRAFASRFAGLPVRNSGTLGGNVANGSPIGDSMPLLIALGANVVLMRWHKGQILHRELPLEQLYTGYRQNVMRPDELLAWIKVPRPHKQERSAVYKISKRYDDDISAVCLALNLRLVKGRVEQASIGVGGVAATPVRARQTEAALRGQAWNEETVRHAQAVLRQEFQPISDMRASAAYRSQVLGNLLQRYWLEGQGLSSINLEAAPAPLNPLAFAPQPILDVTEAA